MGLTASLRSILAKGFALGVLLLSACAPAPTSDGFRDTTVPLTVTTRGSLADLAGTWHLRAHFPGSETLSQVTFLNQGPNTPAVALLKLRCDVSGDCEAVNDVWSNMPLGQNRYRLTQDRTGASIELWVIWVDEGFRTAALGTPDGSFGWIVDRSQKGGEDRITAAREILSFNGYDTLRMIKK